MRLALDQARLAAEAGEVPIGAVVVAGGEIVGSQGGAAPGRNRIPTITVPGGKVSRIGSVSGPAT